MALPGTPLRIVYFTRVPVHHPNGGGHLCCRNHIERLQADGTLDCLFVVAGPGENEGATLDYFRSIGASGIFLPYSPPPFPLPAWQTARWPYLDEIGASQQRGIDRDFTSIVAGRRVDCIVVDYLPSAFYVRTAYRIGVPVVTITLNREAAFVLDLRRHRVPIDGGVPTYLGAVRMLIAEKLVHYRSAATVAIGRHDRGIWMPPYMRPSPTPWTGGNRSLFFVGNIGHFPNRDAVAWLATRFAPELEAIDPSIEIRVVGTGSNDVPAAWRRANIEFLGLSDRATLDRLFVAEAALIAPISNTYGAKFKVAEAISFGTPLLVPESAMSGIPFLPWLRRIRLGRPREAAEMAQALVTNRGAQRSMSARILTDASEFAAANEGAMGRVLSVAVRRSRHSKIRPTPPCGA